jgi:hypothetical protein
MSSCVGPDAAGREQIIVSAPQRIGGVRNRLHHVRHHPHLAQPDALKVQPGADLRNILVVGAARQDLVADHQHGGGPDAWLIHGRLP